MRRIILATVIGLTIAGCSKKIQPAEKTPAQEERIEAELGDDLVAPAQGTPNPEPISEPEQDPNAVLLFAEEIPEFPGGEQERAKFISKNLVYPKKAIKNNIQGSVYAKFIVEKDGSLSNIEIVRSLGHGCDEEVVRVIKLMPRWKPGKQNGEPVRIQMVLPIKFTLK